VVPTPLEHLAKLVVVLRRANHARAPAEEDERAPIAGDAFALTAPRREHGDVARAMGRGPRFVDHGLALDRRAAVVTARRRVAGEHLEIPGERDEVRSLARTSCSQPPPPSATPRSGRSRRSDASRTRAAGTSSHRAPSIGDEHDAVTWGRGPRRVVITTGPARTRRLVAAWRRGRSGRADGVKCRKPRAAARGPPHTRQQLGLHHFTLAPAAKNRNISAPTRRAGARPDESTTARLMCAGPFTRVLGTMSGHSKWADIKHKRAPVDAKRGKDVHQAHQELTVAARMGGGQPGTTAPSQGQSRTPKGYSMPGDTIKNAVKSADG